MCSVLFLSTPGLFPSLRKTLEDSTASRALKFSACWKQPCRAQKQYWARWNTVYCVTNKWQIPYSNICDSITTKKASFTLTGAGNYSFENCTENIQKGLFIFLFSSIIDSSKGRFWLWLEGYGRLALHHIAATGFNVSGLRFGDCIMVELHRIL